MPPSQLVLDLAHPENWDEADFLATPSNAKAFRLVLAWPDWPAPAAVIFGPPQSGKTYLAKIWQARSGAEFMACEELSAFSWRQPYRPLILEDLDQAPLPETPLFHLLNGARENGAFVLLTARTPPGAWPIALADLRSRLRSYPAIGIEPPDETHLAALLVKHFADRHIEVTPDVISYLATRMERSMAAAKQVTAYIDMLALSEQRKITRAFAAKVLRKFGTFSPADEDHNEQGEML